MLVRMRLRLQVWMYMRMWVQNWMGAGQRALEVVVRTGRCVRLGLLHRLESALSLSRWMGCMWVAGGGSTGSGVIVAIAGVVIFLVAFVVHGRIGLLLPVEGLTVEVLAQILNTLSREDAEDFALVFGEF
jgi:hypothetical protein